MPPARRAAAGVRVPTTTPTRRVTRSQTSATRSQQPAQKRSSSNSPARSPSTRTPAKSPTLRKKKSSRKSSRNSSRRMSTPRIASSDSDDDDDALESVSLLRGDGTVDSDDDIETAIASRRTRKNKLKLPRQADWTEEKGNIFFLLLLYTLQGVPIGLSVSMSFLLQARKGSYSNQAIFSSASYPFSFKLFWAPIVDGIYSRAFGRRKSWLVPIQLMCGFFMLGMASVVDDLLDSRDGSEPDIQMLTLLFGTLYFFMATQDVAVDGWALTMLSKHNVGYASTCNSIGQSFGVFLGNAVFLALSSTQFCNEYVRSIPQSEPLLTLAFFLGFWGVMFLIITTALWAFKREKDDKEDVTVARAYQEIYGVIQLPNIKTLIFILLTFNVAFAPMDYMASLKLTDYGMPARHLAFISTLLMPLQMLMARYTAGPAPLSLWMRAYPFRIITGIFAGVVIWYAQHAGTPIEGDHDGDASFPATYFAILVAVMVVANIMSTLMFISVLSFFSKISRFNAAIGGTYMTLLNAVCNFGSKWLGQLSQAMTDRISVKQCYPATAAAAAEARRAVSPFDFLSRGMSLPTGEPESYASCVVRADATRCTEAGGSCVTEIDGFYVLLVASTVVGLLWWSVMRTRVLALQSAAPKSWRAKIGGN